MEPANAASKNIHLNIVESLYTDPVTRDIFRL